jgi:hypothetical protein
MADLTGKKIANTYKDLLQINSSASNSGIDETLRRVQDGAGNNSPLKLSQTSAAFTGNVSIAGSLKVTGTFQPSNLQTTNIVATSITTEGLNATNLIFQNVSVSSLRTGDLFATTVSAGTVSATTVAATNITLAGEPVATSSGLATVSSTMATSIANVSAALETRIANVSSTFASTSATLESHINTVSATLSSTNATLQTSIANVSSTMATSIANVSATLETRIAGVSSTFATTSATLETRIATVSNTLATSIGNQMPLAGGTFTGQVIFDGIGFTVNSNASAVFNGPIKMNSTIQLGNGSGDTISGAGRWGTDIIPNSVTGRDLGNDSLRWDNAYINTFHGGIAATNTSVTDLIYPSSYPNAPANVKYVTSAVATKASVGTSATLETRIATVSNTLATSIATVSAALQTKITTNINAITSINNVVSAINSVVNDVNASAIAANAQAIALANTSIAANASSVAINMSAITSVNTIAVAAMPKAGGTFTGGVTFNDTVIMGGSITQLGNQGSDGIQVTGRFTTDLLPNSNNARDLGSDSLRYADIHGTTIFQAGVTVANTSVVTDLSATLETRIAGVSSTFATTSATLATSIATAAAAAVAFAIALG